MMFFDLFNMTRTNINISPRYVKKVKKYHKIKNSTDMQKQKEEMEKCSKDSEELYIVNEFKTILDVLISEISKLKNLKTDSELTEKIIKENLSAIKAQLQTLTYDITKTNLTTLQAELEKKNKEIQELQNKLKHALEWEKLKNENKILKNKCRELETLNYKISSNLKTAHNKIIVLKGNIRVFCRVCPRTPKEIEQMKALYSINFIDECTIEVGNGSDAVNCNGNLRAETKKFSFDKVFASKASQDMEAAYQVYFNMEMQEEDAVKEEDAVQSTSEKTPKKYLCEVCNFGTDYNSNFHRHERSPSHKKKVEQYKMKTTIEISTTQKQKKNLTKRLKESEELCTVNKFKDKCKTQEVLISEKTNTNKELTL